MRGEIRCAVCQRSGAAREFELHHLDYAGVTRDGDQWHAGEEHRDLVALHPHCHEMVHRILDRDAADGGRATRRDANEQAILRLRAKIARQIQDLLGDG